MKTRARKREGFTLVEVMLAVSVLIVGATGFTLMQGASTRAVQTAYDQTIAQQFLETWVARVRRDASLWNAPGTAGMASSVLLNMGMNESRRGKWFTPPKDFTEAGGTVAAGADSWGWDQASDRVPNDARVCVKLNYSAAHVVGGQVDAVRVDVLAWRPRALTSAVSEYLAGGGINCEHGNKEEDLKRPNPFQVDIGNANLFRAATSILVRWQ